MYLGIDIGGTKTLLAVFDEGGAILERFKFPTSRQYSEFLAQLTQALAKLEHSGFSVAAIAAPGALDRSKDIVTVLGNLPWKNVALRSDIATILNCQAFIENDAKLAAIYEAALHPESQKVLYITVSTGIGVALVSSGKINLDMSDLGGATIMLEHGDKVVPWESFGSGRAIFEKYGKIAAEITDPKAWQDIADNIAIGLIDLIALANPDLVIIGGGVGSHFEKYSKQLIEKLRSYENPLLKIPPVIKATHAEEAVIYGCYRLIMQKQEVK